MPTFRYRLTPAEILRVKHLLAEGVTPSVIALRFRVSTRTICYYKPPMVRGPGPSKSTKGSAAGTSFLVLNPVVLQTEEDACTTPPSSLQA